MILFSLLCAGDHEFEGWFKSNAGFDEQATSGQIACPICGDTGVRKAMMAPAVARSGSLVPAIPTPPATVPERGSMPPAMMRQMLLKVREHVEKNFDHVGDRFAEEARRIHHGESEQRDIWGRATAAEARELNDEGIAVRPLPELPKLDG